VGTVANSVKTSKSDWFECGALLVGCAFALWLISEGVAYYGQTPGEKDFGLGVLVALFLVPALLLGICGLGCLTIGLAVAARRRSVQRD
jgi:hypothetical protein